MECALLIAAVLALAWANGANDNFKGVATLYGSGTLSFRRARALATTATVLGSALSIALARELAHGFHGKGLVPDALTAEPAFLIAVAGAGAATVLLATRLGLPTSTTHALTGALLGVGVASSGSFAGGALWSGFLQPLLISPLVAGAGAAVLYPLFARGRRRLRIDEASSLCVGSSGHGIEPQTGGVAVLRTRVGARALLDGLHGLSGASSTTPRRSPRCGSRVRAARRGRWWARRSPWPPAACSTPERSPRR
jgi:PiT family inorganic phosphate transporter